MKEKIEQANADLERAQRAADFEKASQIQVRHAAGVEAQLQELESSGGSNDRPTGC